MFDWFSALSTANQVFFGIAALFSALFLWQFIMTIIGLAGGESDIDTGGDVDVDTDVGADVDADMDVDAADVGHGDFDHGDFDHGGAEGHEAAVDAADTAGSFRLLSLRSIITGGMMFGWAGALYMYNGVALSLALLYSLVWALAGMFVIALLFYLMRRMQETGTRQLATAVGERGTVYMDIPAGGTGKVRTVVSGTVSFVDARSADHKALKAGTPIRVRRLLDPSTIEVEKATKE